jgi:hypothetical protein
MAKKKKAEQADYSNLDDWEDREPNVSYQIVKGKLVEMPVTRVSNVAPTKKQR